MKFLVCSRLSEHRYKTPEGYLVCVDSILSRTGKQTYSRDELFKDGCTDEVEVERSADEVFSEKTLASFENKPLTIEHPEEDVTPANHNKYSVGFIRDIKRGKDGSEDVMLGTIVVTDAEAIELIETGKLKELSCGYDCDIDDEDNPQQRNIRGNHVALCEKGRAGIARIVDSVKDAIHELEFEVYDYETKKTHKFKFTSGNASNAYDKLQAKAKEVIDNIGDTDIQNIWIDGKKIDPSQVSGSIRYWGTYSMIKKFMGDSISDSIKDAKFEICYIDNGDVCIAIDAKDENDARQKFRRRYGMYYIKHIRKVKDGVKDMKVSHDNIREQPVFVMQSNVDKNLFFYIGKTHAMKEGEWTYTQYDMEGMTPDELRKELEVNGWHKVAKGPAPFIDEDPYEESTEGLEEAEKNLHDEMICNTETDCNDAKTEYVFNYRDTYHGTRDKMRVDANNLDEAIHKFGDTMALGGFGTANIYVVSVSPNDGYMRAYGKLSEMLKQKWTRDSVKDSTYKVEYISSGAEMYPIVEVDAASESEAIETVRKKDKKFVRLISVKKKDSCKKKLDSKKLLSIVKAIDATNAVDRLAPSQYKALRALGYNESKWKNMTSEEASKIIAAAKQKKEGNSEKKEEAKQSNKEETSEESTSKSSNERNVETDKKLSAAEDTLTNLQSEVNDIESQRRSIMNEYKDLDSAPKDVYRKFLDLNEELQSKEREVAEQKETVSKLTVKKLLSSNDPEVQEVMSVVKFDSAKQRVKMLKENVDWLRKQMSSGAPADQERARQSIDKAIDDYNDANEEFKRMKKSIDKESINKNSTKLNVLRDLESKYAKDMPDGKIRFSPYFMKPQDMANALSELFGVDESDLQFDKYGLTMSKSAASKIAQKYGTSLQTPDHKQAYNLSRWDMYRED